MTTDEALAIIEKPTGLADKTWILVVYVPAAQTLAAIVRQRDGETCETCQHSFVGMAPVGRPHFRYCKRTKVPVPDLGTHTYVERRELGMCCGAWLASDAKAALE